MRAMRSQHDPALNTFLGAANKFVRYKAVAKEVTPDYASDIPPQRARLG